MSQGFFSKLLRSRVFFGIILIVFILSSLELINEIGRRNKITKAIQEQKLQIDKLKQDNGDLSNLIEYLNTNSFVESEARKKLNLSKSGESLIVVSSSTGSSLAPNQSPIKNSQQWWNYFFL